MVNMQRVATAAPAVGAGANRCCVANRRFFFRAARAGTLNATPGPAELFEIVNSATARHLADLPDLAAVIAESREAGQDRSVKARGCISQASPTLPSHVQAARRGKQKLTRGRKPEKRERERERERGRNTAWNKLTPS